MDNNFNPFNKLLTGLITFPIGLYFLYFLGESGMEKVEHMLFDLLNKIPFLSEGIAQLITVLVFIWVAWKSLKFFVKGGLQILTFNKQIDILGDFKSTGRVMRGSYENGEYKHIDQALRYRESAMSGMNDSRAAEYYNSSSKLDSDRRNPDKNTRRALRFANSRMSGLNDHEKVRYLQGKRK